MQMKLIAFAVASAAASFGAHAADTALGTVVTGMTYDINEVYTDPGLTITDKITFTLGAGGGVLSGYVSNQSVFFTSYNTEVFQYKPFTVDLGGTPLSYTRLLTGSYPDDGYDEYTQTYKLNPTLLAAGSYTINVKGKADPRNYASYYGSLTVTAVPEPETYALLLAGLGALGFLARRRNA